MSDNLQLTIRDGTNGKLAIINGKTYTLLRLYEHRWMGGIFCLICDDLARTVLAGEIPLGILASLFGAVLFIAMMLSRNIRVQR